MDDKGANPWAEDVELHVMGVRTDHRRKSSAQTLTAKDMSLEEMLGKGGLTDEERDRMDLLRLGKSPVLKRGFGFMAILGFSSSTMVTWESMLGLYDSGYENGGPAGLFYGFIFVWIGIGSVYACLCELSSMAPTSGGQYFWVSMLAPTSCQRFLSYVTGWLTLCGWQCGVASVAYFAGNLVQGLILLTNESYHPQRWHTTLLLWLMVGFAVFINAFSRRLLPRFEGYILLLHILGFFGVLIPLVVLGDYNRSQFVFSEWRNLAGWPTQGLSFMIGTLSPVFAFAGVDGAVHMAEEIQNASVVVPRAIMFSVALNGALGLGIVVATGYVVADIEAALDSKTTFPYMAIFQQATGTITGAAVMSSIVTAMQICTTVAALASGSRMLWSFSRDRGVPGWDILRKVEPKTSLPVRCIALTTLISVLLSFINLGSTAIFNDIVSLTVAGLNGSYLLAIVLLLWRRLTGGITTYTAASSDGVLFNSSGKQLTWGPWRIPGIFGIINNVVACAYIIIIWFFSFWPTGLPVTAENMNWSCVVFSGVMMGAVLYYFVRGRRHYVGPVIEVGAK